MGTGGPGNVVHIDNLYPKTFNVKDNTLIVLGDFVINDSGVRPIVAGDFTANDTFLNLQTGPIYQAGESSNNLDSTAVAQRKTTCECFTKGSDMSAVMRVGVIPDQPVGILRVDGASPVFQIAEQSVANTFVVFKEVWGIYKHKEFDTIADISVQGDDGVISTGLGV